jgi:hypothetical protein
MNGGVISRSGTRTGMGTGTGEDNMVAVSEGEIAEIAEPGDLSGSGN